MIRGASVPENRGIGSPTVVSTLIPKRYVLSPVQTGRGDDPLQDPLVTLCGRGGWDDAVPFCRSRGDRCRFLDVGIEGNVSPEPTSPRGSACIEEPTVALAGLAAR